MSIEVNGSLYLIDIADLDEDELSHILIVLSSLIEIKFILNEDLFDDVVDIIVPDVETDFTVNTIDSKITETPNLGNDTGVSNLIIKAINSEWDTIAEYNELIANLGNNSDMIPVIQDIVAEENTHIGQLQQILLQISPNVQNIEKGEIEGEKQLQETIE